MRVVFLASYIHWHLKQYWSSLCTIRGQLLEKQTHKLQCSWTKTSSVKKGKKNFNLCSTCTCKVKQCYRCESPWGQDPPFKPGLFYVFKLNCIDQQCVQFVKSGRSLLAFEVQTSSPIIEKGWLKSSCQDLQSTLMHLQCRSWYWHWDEIIFAVFQNCVFYKMTSRTLRDSQFKKKNIYL